MLPLLRNKNEKMWALKEMSLFGNTYIVKKMLVSIATTIFYESFNQKHCTP